MKSMILKALLMLVLTLLLLGGGSYYLLNNEAFVRQQIVSLTFKHTGWLLEIGEGFRFSPGVTTRLEAHDVLLRQSGMAEGQPMLRLGSVQLAIHPLSVFDEVFTVDDLGLADCKVLVAKDADGKSNWEIKDKTKEQSAKPDKASVAAKSWRLEQLDITDCLFELMTPERQEPLQLALQRGKLDIAESGRLTAQAVGAVDGHALSLDGFLAPVNALWAGGPVEHEFNLRAGEVVLHSSGTLDEFSTGAGARLKLQFSGPEISWVTQWLALPEISSGGFDLRLNLTGHPDTDAHMNIALDGDLGALQITASGQVDKLVSPASGNLDMNIAGPNLHALGEALRQHWLIASPFESQLKIKFNSTHAQIDTFWLQAAEDRISASGKLGAWPGLLGSELQFDLSSTDLSRWQSSVDNRFHVAGDLHATATVVIESGQGDVRVETKGTLGSADFALDGNLGPMNSFEQLQLEFSVDSQQWNELGNLLGQQHWPAMPGLLSGEVQRDGDSLNLRSVELKSGNDSISAAGHLVLVNQLQGSELSIELDVDDLAATMRAAAFSEETARQLPSRPMKLTGTLSRPGDGFKFDISDGDIGGGRIKLNGLMADIRKPAALNATFSFELPSLQLASLLLPGKGLTDLPDLPFSAQGKLASENASRTHLKDVKLELGDAQAQLEGFLEFDKGLQDSQVSFQVNGENFRNFWPAAPAALGLGSYIFNGNWTRQQDGDYLQDLNIDLGVVRILADGRIWHEDDVPQFDLQIKLDGDDASRFNEISGQSFSVEPFALKTQAKGNRRKILFQDIDYTQGESQAGGQLELDFNSKPRLAGDINSSVFDIRPWQEAAARKKAAEAEQKAKEAAGANGSAEHRFFDETPMWLSQNSALDMDLNIQVSRLLLTAATWQDIKLGVFLEGKLRRLQPIEFRGQKGGRYVGHLIITEENGTVKTAFKADGEGLKLGLAAIEGQDPETFPTSDIAIDLVGTGTSLSELLKSMSGTIRGHNGPGLVANNKLGFFIADLSTQVLGMLNPLAKKDPLTKMQCTVYAVDISNGIAKVGPVVIQTDQVTAYTQGEISLITEDIDLSFNTVARKGLGLSAANLVNPFFKVGGTLTHPAIEIDATKGAISGGAMVATAGISIVVKSMSDRWLSGKDPCGDALKQIRLRDEGKASG